MKQAMTLLMALIMVLSLTACGKTDTASTEETTVPSTTAATQPQKGITLTAQQVGAALKEKLGGQLWMQRERRLMQPGRKFSV